MNRPVCVANFHINAGIRRDMHCIASWVQRRPNRIRRANEPERDDGCTSHEAIRLPSQCHLTEKRTNCHRSDQ